MRELVDELIGSKKYVAETVCMKYGEKITFHEKGSQFEAQNGVNAVLEDGFVCSVWITRGD